MTQYGPPHWLHRPPAPQAISSRRKQAQAQAAVMSKKPRPITLKSVPWKKEIKR